MRTNVYLSYKRELQWAKAKRALQDATYAVAVAALFVCVLVLVQSIDDLGRVL